MGIEDMIAVMTSERKVIRKHHHIESVQAKADQMLQQVKYSKYLFTDLFQKGLPYICDEDGKLISQYEYEAMLVKDRLDHKKFEDMT